MAAVMGGAGSGEPPRDPPLQPSNPADYFDPNVEERQIDRCDDSDNSDPEDVNLDDGQVIPEDQRPFLDFDIIATRPRFTKEVGGILAVRFREPWISFKKVPKQEVEFWWRRFKEKYRWDPAINVPMRKEFNRRCSEFLIRHLGHARRNHEKPSWVKKPQWAEMWKQWNSDGYKKKCETARANRNKNPPGSGMVYRGGSVSMATHRLRMRSSDGQPPSELAVYERCWKKKDGTYAMPLSEEIAKKIAAFEKSRVELQHPGASTSTPSNASSSSNPRSSNQEGNNKKRRVLELGQQAQCQSETPHKALPEPQVGPHRYVPKQDFNPHVDPSKYVPKQDFDRLSAKYKNMKTRLGDMQQLQTMMMQLLSQMSSVFGQQQQLQMPQTAFGQQQPPQMPPWSPWMLQWTPSPWCTPPFTGPGQTSGHVEDASNPTAGGQRGNDDLDDADDVSDSL